LDFCQKKQEHIQPDDSTDTGDMWIWRAMDVLTRLRVVNHISHSRDEVQATKFLANFKARTDGRTPLFTSDKLPAYTKALIDNYSIPEPTPVKRKPGRPRNEPKRIIDPNLRYAQVVKKREGGRIVEVRRQIVFGAEGDIMLQLKLENCGSYINTSYIERDNLTSRHSNSRLVRKTLSHSKKKHFLQRHVDLEDAIYNFVRPHSALRIKIDNPIKKGSQWKERTPAMAVGITNHLWSLEELLSYRLPPPSK